MKGVAYDQEWYERFVRAWQDNEHLRDVAKLMDLRSSRCSAIAKDLRKQGVKLKFYHRGNRPRNIDYAALKKLVKK